MQSVSWNCNESLIFVATTLSFVHDFWLCNDTYWKWHITYESHNVSLNNKWFPLPFDFVSSWYTLWIQWFLTSLSFSGRGKSSLNNYISSCFALWVFDMRSRWLENLFTTQFCSADIEKTLHCIYSLRTCSLISAIERFTFPFWTLLLPRYRIFFKLWVSHSVLVFST